MDYNVAMESDMTTNQINPLEARAIMFGRKTYKNGTRNVGTRRSVTDVRLSDDPGKGEFIGTITYSRLPWDVYFNTGDVVA